MNSIPREQIEPLLRSFPPLRHADFSRPFEIDSVDLLQLVMHLEQSFAVNLSDLDAEPDELRTVEGIVRVLARQPTARQSDPRQFNQ